VDVELNLDLLTVWSVRAYGLAVDPDEAMDFGSPAEFNNMFNIMFIPMHIVPPSTAHLAD